MPENVPIEIVRQPDAGTVIVRPEVDIDMSRSPWLRTAVMQAHEERPGRLVIDLSRVSYMDSSGLATLVEALRTARANQTEMVICGMQHRVLSIFQIARLDQFFTIVGTLEEALAS